MLLFNCIMNTETTLDTIDAYLPATLGPSAIVAGIERRLTAPFRRTYDVWLPDE